MAENGFTFMGRSLKRKMQRILRSPLFSDVNDKLSNPPNAKEFTMVFNAEVSEKLSELAHEEDMDTGPFVLDLVNNAIHGPDTQKMIALWMQLTRREQEVAALACKGMTNPQIAAALHISDETVKKHISSALKKFHIRGRGILKWMLEGWNFENPATPWEI